MIKVLLSLFSWMHNFSYKAISILAIKDNHGIHPKHRILNYHQFFLDNVSEDDSILDIGCGNGAVAYDISKKVKKVIAIDISEKDIMTAKKKYSSNNLDYIVGDATRYDFKGNFDAIILSNVLEHIENRIEFLTKIKNLAPKILIRVPLLTRDWLSVFKKENGLEYRLDSTHFIEYTEQNFQEEIEKVGLKIDSYYVKFGEIYCVIKA